MAKPSVAKSKKSARPKSKPKGKPRGRPWPKGQSGNPKGAPKRGESWAERVREIGDLTPADAIDKCSSMASRLRTYPQTDLTLKDLGILSAFMALIFDPDARMFNALADRAEGKPIQPITGKDGGPIEFSDARERLERLITERLERERAAEVATKPK